MFAHQFQMFTEYSFSVRESNPITNSSGHPTRNNTKHAQSAKWCAYDTRYLWTLYRWSTVCTSVVLFNTITYILNDLKTFDYNCKQIMCFSCFWYYFCWFCENTNVFSYFSHYLVIFLKILMFFIFLLIFTQNIQIFRTTPKTINQIVQMPSWLVQMPSWLVQMSSWLVQMCHWLVQMFHWLVQMFQIRCKIDNSIRKTTNSKNI